jgi:hypothetical protein
MAAQNVQHPAGPAVATAVLTLGFLFRRSYLRWGATADEVEGEMPGAPTASIRSGRTLN